LIEAIALICARGTAQIPAQGSTKETRFACRRCCARIQRERNQRSVATFDDSQGSFSLNYCKGPISIAIQNCSSW